MSVCPSCGFRNPRSDPFCRNPACGAFLGWGEERAVGDQDDTQPFDTAAEARRPEPPDDARAAGTRSPGVRSALGTSDAVPRRPTPPTGPPAAPTGPVPASNGTTGTGTGSDTGTGSTGTGTTAGTGTDTGTDTGTGGRGVPDGTAAGGATPDRTAMDAHLPSFPPTSWFDRDEPWGRPAPADPWREPEQPWTEPEQPGPEHAPRPGPGPVQRPWEAAPTHDRPELPPDTARPPAPQQYSSFPSEAQLLRRPPLWERLLRRLPVPLPGEGRLRKAPSVRHRERRRALLRFGALVVVIVLVGGGLWLASVRGRSATTSTGPGGTAAAPSLVRVRPTGVVASTESGSRLAGNVVDGKLDTFWSRLAPSPDDQPFLRFSFDHPVDLGRVSIAAGASGSQFPKRPRPQDIELRFSDGSSLRATLADRRGFQAVTFSPRQVDLVRLVVLSTYPSSGAQRTSISEIRFYRVKG